MWINLFTVVLRRLTRLVHLLIEIPDTIGKLNMALATLSIDHYIILLFNSSGRLSVILIADLSLIGTQYLYLPPLSQSRIFFEYRAGCLSVEVFAEPIVIVGAYGTTHLLIGI